MFNASIIYFVILFASQASYFSSRSLTFNLPSTPFPFLVPSFIEMHPGRFHRRSGGEETLPRVHRSRACIYNKSVFVRAVVSSSFFSPLRPFDFVVERWTWERRKQRDGTMKMASLREASRRPRLPPPIPDRNAFRLCFCINGGQVRKTINAH